MNYTRHSELEGKHAFLGASKSGWLRKSPDELFRAYARTYITTIGTAIHDIARKHIKHSFPVTLDDKNSVLLSLVEDYKIPLQIIDAAVDFASVFDNFMIYVNDCIDYDMVPEQILYYSYNCFATTDAINRLDDIMENSIVRVSDLKTGTTPVHKEQIFVYMSLVCLEYNLRPGELEFVGKIFQNGEIQEYNPTGVEIAEIMDTIVMADNIIRNKG